MTQNYSSPGPLNKLCGAFKDLARSVFRSGPSVHDLYGHLNTPDDAWHKKSGSKQFPRPTVQDLYRGLPAPCGGLEVEIRENGDLYVDLSPVGPYISYIASIISPMPKKLEEARAEAKRRGRPIAVLYPLCVPETARPVYTQPFSIYPKNDNNMLALIFEDWSIDAQKKKCEAFKQTEAWPVWQKLKGDDERRAFEATPMFRDSLRSVMEPENMLHIKTPENAVGRPRAQLALGSIEAG